MLFRARQFKFSFPRPALVMGIVNVTPDSFSDGGKFLDTNVAVAHALKLVEQGADILDIGGESTRPNARPTSEAEELNRVIPVISALKRKIKIPISIDTMKPIVALTALESGASIVNDVGANRKNDLMWNLAARFRAGYICMHAPPTLHKTSAKKNIVADVEKFFLERTKRLNAAGVSSDQTVFDPGIGFGKTLEQNVQLLASLRRFIKLNRPLTLGVSRKSFLGKLTGADVNERLPASLACAILAIEAGAQIIRAHDVAETVQAVRMAEAILKTTEK